MSNRGKGHQSSSGPPRYNGSSSNGYSQYGLPFRAAAVGAAGGHHHVSGPVARMHFAQASQSSLTIPVMQQTRAIQGDPSAAAAAAAAYAYQQQAYATPPNQNSYIPYPPFSAHQTSAYNSFPCGISSYGFVQSNAIQPQPPVPQFTEQQLQQTPDPQLTMVERTAATVSGGQQTISCFEAPPPYMEPQQQTHVSMPERQRASKRVAIIDPDTMKEVNILGDEKPPRQTCAVDIRPPAVDVQEISMSTTITTTTTTNDASPSSIPPTVTGHIHSEVTKSEPETPTETIVIHSEAVIDDGLSAPEQQQQTPSPQPQSPEEATLESGLEPVSPTPLPVTPPSEHSSPKSSCSNSAIAANESVKSKKNKSKSKKAELNRKGDEKSGGSDMDAFKDLASSSGKKSTTVAPESIENESSSPLEKSVESEKDADQQEAKSKIEDAKTEVSNSLDATKLEEVETEKEPVVAVDVKIPVDKVDDRSSSDEKKITPTDINELADVQQENETSVIDLQEDSKNEYAKNSSSSSIDIPNVRMDEEQVSKQELRQTEEEPKEDDKEDIEKNVMIDTNGVQKESSSSESSTTATTPSSETTATTPSSETTANGVPDKDSSAAAKLKYEYKTGQWSPLNLEGKKEYDRDFLIQLQKDPLSLTRPNNLPQMEIIKLEANELIKAIDRKSRTQGSDFMPPFSGSVIVKTTSRGGLTKRPSRDGRNNRSVPGRPDSRMAPPPIITGLSFQEKVELHTTDQAWKPLGKKDVAPDAANGTTPDTKDKDGLLKAVRGILNKLTPQKFDVLIKKFDALAIDSEEELRQCINLVFEKAVNEPEFSAEYASMCEVMQRKKVDANTGLPCNFRHLLIVRCQTEFEKDYMDEIDGAKHVKDIKEAETEERRKELIATYEYEERKARRRSLGNIRFIGELYKLKMLTLRIMRECLHKLLKMKNEESLECLCRLLSTVGKTLESERSNKQGTEPDVSILQSHFEELKSIAADMNKSNRIRFMIQDLIDLRRNNWKPRRETGGPKKINEIHKDVEREKTQQQFTSFSRNDSRSGHRGGPPSMSSYQGDKRSSRGSQQGGGGSGGQHQPDEYGWTVSKASVRANNDRIDMIKIKNMVSSNVVDAENIQLGPTGASGLWSKGSMSGSRQSQSKSDEPITQTNRFGSLSASFDRDQSSADNSSSKTSSMDRTKLSSSTSFKNKFMGQPDLSRSAVQNLSAPIVEEYLINSDDAAAVSLILEKMHLTTMVYFVDYCLNNALDKKVRVRNLTGNLLAHLIIKDVVSRSDLESVVYELVEIAPDLMVDIPKFWDYLPELIAPMVKVNALSLSSVMKLAGSKALSNQNQGPDFLANVLRLTAESTNKKIVSDMWKNEKLSLESLIGAEKISEFIERHGLDYIHSASGSSNTVRDKLRELLLKKESNNVIFKWIDSTFGPEKARENEFVRLLCDECFVNAIDDDREFKKAALEERCSLMKRYLENVREREKQALYAAQRRVSMLTHPPKLLQKLFVVLHEHEVVTTEAFDEWLACKDPAEAEGKGAATSSTLWFFTWLHEASY